ncbi:metallophosphoesterase [Candidatus Daviesbacteria bacterium]|nr:metallophosphoesterase [Candidatus Daviesbacteria bacterium]
MTKNSRIKIAAIGDLHTKEEDSDRFVQLFENISKSADILVLCGDLTDHGLTQQAEALTKNLHFCTIPVVGVLGNHDYENNLQDQIKHILSPVMLIFDKDPIEIKNIGFAGAKGFAGGFDDHMLGPFGEEPLKKFVQEAIGESLVLENQLSQLHTLKKVVVLHYAPIVETVIGEPLQIHPFLGSSRLVEPINRFKVNAVFHGHAHFGSAEGKTLTGIPVYNASIFVQERRNKKKPYILVEI